MTATNAGSVAILKRRYPDGKLPKAQFEEFPFMATVTKKEDFIGDDKVIALQTENPQGIGSSIPNAQAGVAQGNYVRFLLTRLEYFGVARIKGQALRTATMKGGGALVDLWTNECDGVSASVMKMLEIFWFGNGNAVLGTTASGTATTTVTLVTKEDINAFDLGMTLGAVSDTTLSPTIRVGTAKVTGIDRANGTLTFAAAPNSTITGLVNGDSFVRAGDGSVAGAPVVPTGMDAWLVGGTTPGSLYSLNRNPDPVRMASQVYDATGVPIDNAVVEAESLITIQGKLNKKRLWCNPRELTQLKKSQMGKVAFPREKVASTIASLSFNALQFEGDADTIDIMTSPFCRRNTAKLIDQETFAIESAGAAPMLLDFDKNDFLRIATDDAYEVRFGLYGNYSCKAPVKSIRLINVGV